MSVMLHKAAAILGSGMERAGQKQAKERSLPLLICAVAIGAAATGRCHAQPEYRIAILSPPQALVAPAALSLGDFQKEIPPVLIGGEHRRSLFGAIESFNCTGG